MQSSCRSAGGCEFRRAGDCSRQPRLSAFTRALSLLVVLASAPRVQALDASKEIRDYVLDQWDVRHGLPFSTVRAIRQTPDGYLWLGTQTGLVRFDGQTFTVFNVQTTPELGNFYSGTPPCLAERRRIARGPLGFVQAGRDQEQSRGHRCASHDPRRRCRPAQ